MDELKNENLMLRDLLQNRVPVGCVAETTYQPILDENEKLKEENNGLKEDIKLLTEAGEKTSELLWSSTEKQKELKEENEKLKDKLWDVEETIRVAIASRLAHWFPDEKMGDNEYAEDCDIANNLNGDDLVNMIDGFRKGDLTKIKELQDEIGKLWKKSFDDLIEDFDELNYKEDLVLMEDQNCVEGRDGMVNLNEIELAVMGGDWDCTNLVNRLAKWFDDIPVEIAIQHQNDWIKEAGVGLMDDY